MIDTLIKWLLTQTEVTSITSTRIFPSRALQGTLYPQILVHQVSRTGPVSLAGPSDLVRSRLQLDCVGRTYTDAKLLAAVLTYPTRQGGLLNGFSGSLGTPSIAINSAIIHDETDIELPPVSADDSAKYMVALDLVIWYTRGAQ